MVTFKALLDIVTLSVLQSHLQFMCAYARQVHPGRLHGYIECMRFAVLSIRLMSNLELIREAAQDL